MFENSIKVLSKSRTPFRPSKPEKSLGHYVTDFFSASKLGKMNPDQVVHYKIFLCVAGYEPEIRRITIDKDICHNYFYLKQKILAIFPTLKDVAFTISWKDREGDNIRICTDDELGIALREMDSFDFKKIYVNATPQGKEGPMHPDVICDGCDNPVQGFRYKCIVCFDYDLCPDCERSQLHPDHPMIRIPLPLSAEMPFGRRFARDISRMSKHLERLFQQTADHFGDKKAKGDYSGCSRSTPNFEPKRHHKMKFCTQNEVHNFIHNLLFSHIEKMKNSSGDSSSASKAQPPSEPHQPEPQPSSSTTDAYPIYEEQKKFVNILTNGLNSFLDPLGIDVVVEEDPVKDENSQKHPDTRQSASTPSEGISAGTSAVAAAAPGTAFVSVAAPQPEVTSIDAPVPADPTPVLPLNFVAAPIAVVAPAAPARTVGMSPLMPVSIPPVLTAPSSTMGVPAPTATVRVSVPESMPAVGVQPPTYTNAQLTFGVPPQTPAPLGVQPPTISAPPQTYIANPTQSEPPMPASAAPISAPREEVPVLDSSWTIINDGMGESFLFQHSPAAQASALPQGLTPGLPPAETAAPQAPQRVSQQSDRIYPRLSTRPPTPPTVLSTEDALKHMEMMGFKSEEWLRQLIESKKGNIDEVLRFLSPIPKPSTNLNPNY